MSVPDASAGVKYENLITSEHNQRINFMALVNLYAQAMGEIIQGTLSIQQAFDLDLAWGPQLDVIGQWVGQSRVVPNVLTLGYFGFSDDFSALPFGELSDGTKGGRFYEQGTPVAVTTTLSDPDYRTVLRAVIVRNQSQGKVSDIERALSYLFTGSSVVTDSSDLNLTITVSSPIAPTSLALVTTLDILPRPATVSISSITFASGS